MATETLYMNVLSTNNNLLTPGNAIDDPGSSPNTWTTNADNSAWDAIGEFATPTGDQANGTHTFTARVRKDPGSNNPNFQMIVQDAAGSTLGDSGAVSITSTTEQTVTVNVAGSTLQAGSGGLAGVRVSLIGSQTGGGPSARSVPQIDYVQWSGDFTTASSAPPVADAGSPQSVRYGDTVNLDGTASSDDVAITAWSWAVTGNTTGQANPTITNPTTSTPSFTAPSGSGDVTLTLTVTDGDSQQDTDTVVISITSQDPVADAGSPQTVEPSGVAENISIVQQASPGTEFNGDAVVASFASTPTPGNHLLFVFHSTSTVADNPPTGVTEVAYADDSGRPTKAYLRQVQSGDGTDWSFASTNITTATNELHGYEIEGLADNPVDIVVSGTAGTYTSMQLGSTGTLSQGDELIVVAVGLGGTSGGSESITSPAIAVDGASDHPRTINGVLIVSETTALNPTIAWTTSRRANGFILTLKQAPSGTPSPVYLDGTNSSDDVGITSALWEIIGNTTGEADPTITNPTSLSTAEFNAPAAEGTITVRLTVTDADGQQSTDTVVITVEIAATTYTYTWHVQGGSDTAVTGLQWHNQGGSDDAVTTTDWHTQV